MSFPRTFTITTQPYLDKSSLNNQCYKNILMINVVPDGPLNAFVRRLQLPRLSPFQTGGSCDQIQQCGLVLINPFLNSCSYSYSNNCGKNGSNYMTPNEIPNLYSFLTANGYQIETQLTNMMNNSEVKLTNSRIVCSATYFGNNQPNICYMK